MLPHFLHVDICGSNTTLTINIENKHSKTSKYLIEGNQYLNVYEQNMESYEGYT